MSETIYIPEWEIVAAMGETTANELHNYFRPFEWGMPRHFHVIPGTCRYAYSEKVLDGFFPCMVRRAGTMDERNESAEARRIERCVTNFRAWLAVRDVGLTEAAANAQEAELFAGSDGAAGGAKTGETVPFGRTTQAPANLSPADQKLWYQQGDLA